MLNEWSSRNANEAIGITQRATSVHTKKKCGIKCNIQNRWKDGWTNECGFGGLLVCWYHSMQCTHNWAAAQTASNGALGTEHWHTSGCVCRDCVVCVSKLNLVIIHPSTAQHNNIMRAPRGMAAVYVLAPYPFIVTNHVWADAGIEGMRQFRKCTHTGNSGKLQERRGTVVVVVFV